MKERTFQLTNEFRVEGPVDLVAILCASHETVSWGPAKPLIDSAFSEGRSPLSAEGIIRLVDGGRMKIMARGEWLTERSFRSNHAWPLAREWDDDFDGVLRQWAIDDHALPLDLTP
ncbi:MAG: hypothetical protein ACYTGN_12040 [Planctomycetota bacterium]|jgi:hypothetical protein